MAGELRVTNTSGTTVYAIILFGNQVWTGANTFNTISPTNINTNTIALTEQNATGIFTGNFPVGITTPGRFFALFYQQSGGSPNVANDVLLGSSPQLDWNGGYLSTIGISLPMQVKKNQPLNNFVFLMLSASTALPLTGATVTPQVSRDGGTPGATSNGVTEVGLGLYKINLTAADLNGTNIALLFTATGAAPTYIFFIAQS